MYQFDETYCIDQFKNLLDIDSTTGQFKEIESYLVEECKNLGYQPETMIKGGVIVDLGGKGNELVVTAHADDIGLMVRKINDDGTLQICPVGGIYPFYSVMDNVRIHTFDEKVYSGTICRNPGSVHVTEEELRDTMGDFRKNVCVVLDEDVENAQDVKELGIEVGNMIGILPRFMMINNYIKSRFIDDKICVAILLAVMKYLKENNIELPRNVKAYFAMHEEVGHGTSYLPEGTKELLAIDTPPVGPDQTSSIKKVTIFAKDTRMAYHVDVVKELRKVALANNIDYVTDVITPHAGTDVISSVMAGYDIRYGAIGPGEENSHGYERTHLDGVIQTYQLLLAYMMK